MTEHKPSMYDGMDSWGEQPEDVKNVPGAIKVDEVPHRIFLEEEAEKHLAKFPEIRKGAERLGKDMVAFTSAHGKEIIIGVGVAATIGVGGVVLYKHIKNKK